jgi:uncharacterized membrane protein
MVSRQISAVSRKIVLDDRGRVVMLKETMKDIANLMVAILKLVAVLVVAAAAALPFIICLFAWAVVILFLFIPFLLLL